MAASTEFKSKSLLKAESAFTAMAYQLSKDKTLQNSRMIKKLCKTLSNWAAFYQKHENFHMATACYLKLSKLLEKTPKNDAKFAFINAETRYNFSTLYMRQKKFFEALKHSKKALEFLNIAYKLQKQAHSAKTMKGILISYLFVYYNIGYCEESLGNFEKMQEAYNRALEMADKHLENGHYMVGIIQRAFSEASESRTVHSRSTHKSREILPSPSSKEIQHLEPPVPGISRYYSSEDLEKLQKSMNEAESLQFVSADEFFYSKISKALNLEEDVRHIKNNADKTMFAFSRKDDHDKQKISELRLRRHCRHIKIEDKGPDFIKERLSYIEQQEEANSKKLEVQMKSRLKSTSHRTLADLHTKPNTDRDRGKTRYGERAELLQDAKNDIEGLMDKLIDEIKFIDLCQRGGNARKNNKKKKTCLLARSAYEKHIDINYRKNIVQNSLLAALKGKYVM